MEIDAHTITVRHDGARRTLVVQGRPYGVALKLTLPQLESLALSWYTIKASLSVGRLFPLAMSSCIC